MKRRVLFGSFVLAVAFGVVAAVPAGATIATFDVSTDQATCNTVGGLVKFGTALHAGGVTAETGTIKGKVDGCTDAAKPSVKMFRGTYAGSFNGTNNDCAAWVGLNLMGLTGGAWTITWTPASGQDFIPKTLVGSVLKRITSAPSSGWLDSGPGTLTGFLTLSGSYVGVGFAGAPTTGDFATAGGAEIGGYVQSDAGLLFSQCASTAGVKSLTIGLGSLIAGQ